MNIAAPRLSFFVRVTDSNGLSMLVPVRVDIIN